ncbi:MAG: hypothetical protein ACJ72D_30135 [Marmoricola sp.]
MNARRWGRTAVWAAVAALVAMTVLMVGWRLHGGRWVRVETASMGTQAPVGTLLWVAPVRYDDLRPGDLVTFRAPGSGATYSHLVRSRNADGTISTQGRITAPDPWRLGPDDVIGKVVHTWPGVGWLVVAAPVLIGGGALVAALCWRVRDRDLRLPLAVVGVAVVLAVGLVVYRPLTRAEQISFVPAAHGARATYVSTGLVPVRLSARGGDSVVLRDGQVGSVLARATGAEHRRYAVTISPQLALRWWLVLVGACFTPALARGVVRLCAGRNPSV